MLFDQHKELRFLKQLQLYCSSCGVLNNFYIFKKCNCHEIWTCYQIVKLCPNFYTGIENNYIIQSWY